MPQTTTIIDITLLKENPDNPRTITEAKFEALVTSIKKFPQMMEVRPIVTTSDLVALGGNMRLRAAKAAGLTHVPVIIADGLTAEQQREFVIKDNVGFGDWDWGLIQSEWPEAPEWGLDIPDWVKPKVEAMEDDYDIPDEIQTDIVVGDLFEIGPHRLLCGDSTKVEEVERLMDGKKADMVFTDPPYGLGGYGGRKKMRLIGDDLDVQQFYNCIPDDVAEVYVWGRVENYQHINFTPRDVIVWKKNNFGLGRGYRGQYEVCFYKGDFNGSDSDVWEVDKDVNYKHPTQKPVALPARAIDNSDPKLIYDPFLGSGTTMVAAHQLNRKCYGIEIDPKYCQVILDRMMKLDPALIITKNGVALTDG